RGTDLPVVIDINQPIPGSSDPASEQARRPFAAAFPPFRVINTLSDIAHSNYNSLQVSAQRSAANLTFRASYTFSKSLDDASAAGRQPQPAPRLWPLGFRHSPSLYRCLCLAHTGAHPSARLAARAFL